MKKTLSPEQKKLVQNIGKKKPNSAEALLAMNFDDNVLEKIRSTKWKDYQMSHNELKHIQLAKQFITSVLHKKSMQINSGTGNFSQDRTARQNNHHLEAERPTQPFIDSQPKHLYDNPEYANA